MQPSNHIDVHTCHEMMLEGGAESSAEEGCRSKGRGFGSGGACPPLNTYRRREVTVPTSKQPCNIVASIKSVKPTIQRTFDT